MRIVAGVAGGRRLQAPKGRGTRPTSDRAREALFASLGSLGVDPAGSRFADLFAGSGAVGLEALSRGAGHVLLVEQDQAAVAVIRANLHVVGLPGAEVHVGAVERRLATPPTAPYDVVFADPPYDLAEERLTAVLAALTAPGWLGPDSVVVVERSTRGGEPAWPPGLVAERSRRYGEGTLWYGRPAG